MMFCRAKDENSTRAAGTGDSLTTFAMFLIKSFVSSGWLAPCTPLISIFTSHGKVLGDTRAINASVSDSGAMRPLACRPVLNRVISANGKVLSGADGRSAPKK
jgi:hypothetical protein